MKKYKIKDFSEKLGVTPDLVNYYEEIGVLKSDIDRNNNYRSFKFNQARHIYETIKYRNLGFKIKQAKNLITSDNPQQIKQALIEKQMEIEEKIKILQSQLKALENGINACDRINDEFFIEYTDDFIFFPHTDNFEYIEDKTHIEQLKKWLDMIPVAVPCQMCCIDEDFFKREKIQIDSFSHGLIIPKDTAFKHNLPVNERCTHISKRKFLKVVCVIERDYENQTPQQHTEKTFEKLREIINNNNFILGKHIFKIFEMFSNSDGKLYLHYMILAEIA